MLQRRLRHPVSEAGVLRPPHIQKEWTGGHPLCVGGCSVHFPHSPASFRSGRPKRKSCGSHLPIPHPLRPSILPRPPPRFVALRHLGPPARPFRTPPSVPAHVMTLHPIAHLHRSDPCCSSFTHFPACLPVRRSMCFKVSEPTAVTPVFASVSRAISQVSLLSSGLSEDYAPEAGKRDLHKGTTTTLRRVPGT